MIEEEKQAEQEEDAELTSEEELRQQVEELQNQIATLEEENSQKLIEFIEKKSKEAEEIIAKKEEELRVKFQKEVANMKAYLYESQFAELVGIISNFQVAIDMATAPEISAYLAGFRMFCTQFQSLLRDLNISEFCPSEHDEFDSSCMEASVVEAVEDQELDNKVLKVFSKGYKLNERVIKLSSVKVGKVN